MTVFVRREVTLVERGLESSVVLAGFAGAVLGRLCPVLPGVGVADDIVMVSSVMGGGLAVAALVGVGGDMMTVPVVVGVNVVTVLVVDGGHVSAMLAVVDAVVVPVEVVPLAMVASVVSSTAVAVVPDVGGVMLAAGLVSAGVVVSVVVGVWV